MRSIKAHLESAIRLMAQQGKAQRLWRQASTDCARPPLPWHLPPQSQATVTAAQRQCSRSLTDPRLPSHTAAAYGSSFWTAPALSRCPYSTRAGPVSLKQLQRKYRHLDPLQLAAKLADAEAAPGVNSDSETDSVPSQLGTSQDHEESDEVQDPFAPRVSVIPAGQQAGGPRRRRIGVLQSVPTINPAHEHLASALKRASKVVPNSSIKNEAEKERNRAARQMDTLMKELSVPLTKYLAGFPDPDRLHPFDATLLQLTVNTTTYRSVLSKVDALRKSVQETGKSYANRAKNAQNKMAASEAAIEGAQAMENAYRKRSDALGALKEIAKKLRSLPVVELGLPTLALVGAPNVGKSSLVQVLSSGTPEICNYPFTTRSIKMGHFFLDGDKHQVTDTPGLLSRPDVERNTMELLTLAALEHLPTSVLYVMDLTEECGTSLQDQWDIRLSVRERFPDKDWIDVFSKADMLTAVFTQADTAPQPADSNVQGTPQSAAEFAARLPHALRVSSTTQAGIPKLQLSIVRMFEAQKERAREREEQQQTQQKQVSEDVQTHAVVLPNLDD